MCGQQILIHSEYAQWSRIFSRLGGWGGGGGGGGGFLSFQETFLQQTFEYGHVVPYKTGTVTLASLLGGPDMGVLAWGHWTWSEWFDIHEIELTGPHVTTNVVSMLAAVP